MWDSDKLLKTADVESVCRLVGLLQAKGSKSVAFIRHSSMSVPKQILFLVLTHGG